MNLTDHENQTSMSTETQKNDDVSIDIDLSFDDDKNLFQSDSDEDENDTAMPFDLPSWPRKFGEDDTLRLPSNISIGQVQAEDKLPGGAEEPLISPESQSRLFTYDMRKKFYFFNLIK